MLYRRGLIAGHRFGTPRLAERGKRPPTLFFGRFDPAHYGENTLSRAVTIEIVSPFTGPFRRNLPCG